MRVRCPECGHVFFTEMPWHQPKKGTCFQCKEEDTYGYWTGAGVFLCLSCMGGE